MKTYPDEISIFHFPGPEYLTQSDEGELEKFRYLVGVIERSH